MEKKLVDIDGSVMEGGGSIVRVTSALSAMAGKPLRLYNIRSGRPQPGLRTQHLRGFEAISDLCGGRLEGAKIGATEVLFYPRKVSGEHVHVPIETAGSVGLVLQSLMMASVKTKKNLTIDIEGGATFGKYAPPLQYIQFVLLPLLRRTGYHSEINIIKHGFYPVGGSVVKVTIDPPEKLKPVTFEKQGKVTSVDVVSVASLGLKKPRVAERQARQVEARLKKMNYDLNVKVRYSEAACNGSGVVLIARTDEGCILGSDGLGERGKSAEEVADEAVSKLLDTIGSGAAVDEYMSDQLLPYMALASGKSAITAPVLTSHAQTNIHILEKFLSAKFDVKEESGRTRIECNP